MITIYLAPKERNNSDLFLLLYSKAWADAARHTCSVVDPLLDFSVYATDRRVGLGVRGGRKGNNSMRASILKKYKKILLSKRAEIIDSPERSTVVDEAMRTGDWVDHSSQENDLHVNLALKQTDTKLLRAIDDALGRVEQGTFGICMDCEEPIAEVRLDAVAWTRVCIDCKERQD